jgi:hypothetical protein
MTKMFRQSLSIKDNQIRPISINFTQNSIFMDGRFKFVYCLYYLDLYNHTISYSKFMFNKPNDQEIFSLVKKLLETNSKTLQSDNVKFSIVAFKGSPFFNKKVQDFLEKNKIPFFYYTKENVPPMVSIVNAYMTRMLELHILYNNRIDPRYVMKLLEFWKKEIIPITYHLSDINLIEDKPFLIPRSSSSTQSRLEIMSKETKDQGQDIQSFNSSPECITPGSSDWSLSLGANSFHENPYIYKTNERAFMLVSVSAKLNERTSWNILSFFNLLTLEFVDEIYTNELIKEKHIIHFLKEKFEKNRINCLFIPEGPQFSSQELFEFYQAMELQVVVVDNNPKFLEQRMYLTMMKIIHNYIKDSLSKGLSPKNGYKPDIELMKLHWNNHISKIFKAQVDLASQFYSNDNISEEEDTV